MALQSEMKVNLTPEFSDALEAQNVWRLSVYSRGIIANGNTRLLIVNPANSGKVIRVFSSVITTGSTIIGMLETYRNPSNSPVLLPVIPLGNNGAITNQDVSATKTSILQASTYLDTLLFGFNGLPSRRIPLVFNTAVISANTVVKLPPGNSLGFNFSAGLQLSNNFAFDLLYTELDA